MKVLSTSKAVFDEIENLVLCGLPTFVFSHNQDPKPTFGKVFTRGAKGLTKKQENDEDGD